MYHTVLGVPYSEGIVIKNAINPIPMDLIDKSPLMNQISDMVRLD